MKLTPEDALASYRKGRFPMGDPYEGGVDWFEPERRGIIPLEHFHAPRRLLRYMKRFRFTADLDFPGVIDGCARPVTWISQDIRDVFLQLHWQGVAHSIEAWRDGKLAGGLYGIHLGGAFMAESMFRAADNASSGCLVKLVERLRARGFVLLDIQQVLPHSARFGAVEVSRADYRRRLSDALKVVATWGR